MKPKILGYYLRNEIRTGGHRRYLELLNSLSKKGYKVTVFLGDTIDPTEFNFNIVPLKPVYKGKILPYSFKQMIRVLPQLFKLEKDNWVSLAFGETNYLTMVAAKLILKSKIVFAFRSNSYRAKKDQFLLKNNKISTKQSVQLLKMKYLEKRITKLSDKLIYQTTFDRDDIINRTNTFISKTRIIPNSISESWFLEEYKNTNSSNKLKNIIYLGSYDNRKGVIYLLKAIKILVDKQVDLKLDMFGYGKEKSTLENFVKTNNLEEYVIINDKLSNPLSTMGSYDLMIVPSIYDSYPNVILESLFTGTPVLASDNSGMKEILQYPELLFKTGDSQDIADKIEKIANNSDTYKKIKELCKIRLDAHDFSWPEMFEKEII